jgi:hypothetical protein
MDDSPFPSKVANSRRPFKTKTAFSLQKQKAATAAPRELAAFVGNLSNISH